MIALNILKEVIKNGGGGGTRTGGMSHVRGRVWQHTTIGTGAGANAGRGGAGCSVRKKKPNASFGGNCFSCGESGNLLGVRKGHGQGRGDLLGWT
jgi:hypothetical protein